MPMSNSFNYRTLLKQTSNNSSSEEEEENGVCLESIPLMCGDSFEMDESDRLVNERRRRSRGIFNHLSQRWSNFCTNCWGKLFSVCCREKELQPRIVHIGLGVHQAEKHPRNVVRNQKYSIITFIPIVLFEQFKFFLNLYFLVMALSQLLPELRIGYLYTYWGPLGFVLFVTMCREALDDYRRYRRDKEANSQKYKKLTRDGIVRVPSSDIQVGHLIILEKNQRVPADIVLLRTSEKDGGCFIRTDQLDGETDWKLRLAVQETHRLQSNVDILDITAQVYAEKPQKAIHNFVGTFTRTDSSTGTVHEDSLSIENTLWANTVVASGTALGVVIYTGCETRSVMNTSQPKSKTGLLDLEINTLTKLLFLAVIILSLVMMILKGFGGPWYRYFFRFVLLFSYIIPISLRVNLDMGKAYYSWVMQRDKNMPGMTARSTTIPEELGRITYLLSDKTGTLTQNEMVFKRLHLGTVSFTPETMDEVITHLKISYSATSTTATPTRTSGPVRRNVLTRVVEAVRAIALCHNVTPVYEESGNGDVKNDDTEADQQLKQKVTYQASSPDEIALVSWAESVNLALVKRDLNSIKLRTPTGALATYTILQIFPFTSESKRMGIIVRDTETGEITFYLKGADVVMQGIVQYNDWLEEECGNMAREGLRTLVVAKKILTEEQYQEFESRYHQAKMSIQERNSKMQAVIEGLERDMELLCLTGLQLCLVCS
ncbi:unnamed protein product [Lymnaea stagnalis]|uniref:Phospholipid-transporting ATPase n=1 Tax=Lymnaea stagnalis TaxID=6523 RepID=A0AAV2I4I2_LYMST